MSTPTPPAPASAPSAAANNNMSTTSPSDFLKRIRGRKVIGNQIENERIRE